MGEDPKELKRHPKDVAEVGGESLNLEMSEKGNYSKNLREFLKETCQI